MHGFVIVRLPQGIPKLFDKLNRQCIPFFGSVQFDSSPATIDFIGNMLEIFSVHVNSGISESLSVYINSGNAGLTCVIIELSKVCLVNLIVFPKIFLKAKLMAFLKATLMAFLKAKLMAICGVFAGSKGSLMGMDEGQTSVV